ncbi:hypothetical protein FRC14_002079 [Serendipita sp. 396]|nr:hypothetical protein FRC14_002079 [Serendipita sp. 396]KAG8800907.1 hypothetical protein FRC16_001779 [Serendipita sp. 398]
MSSCVSGGSVDTTGVVIFKNGGGVQGVWSGRLETWNLPSRLDLSTRSKMSFRSSGKPYARTTSGGGIPDGQWLHDKAPGAEKTRAPRVTESHNVSGQNAKLLVDNLHYEVSERDLVSLFGKYGSFAREPRIRFDRSGRSLGTAVIVFENVEDAKAAQRGLNRQLAKGQELIVRFDDTPTNTRGAASLLARMDKGSSSSLASRLGDAPRGSENGSQSTRGGIGPHRNRGGRGGGGRGAQGRERPSPKKPLTAEQLDKDLDSYGAQTEGPAAVQAGPADGGPASTSKTTDEDVEMS